MLRLAFPWRLEEQQYVPFVAGALFFGLVVGFPLGFTLAHAAAQDSNLGGRWAALVQAHGHLQLMGWGGLFVMGMGLRLVPRFTGIRIKPVPLPLVVFALVASGLLLRTLSQPLADAVPMAVLLALSAILEAGGVFLFSTAILRCLAAGRREEFSYTPFFAAGSVWVAVAAALNLAFITDAAADSIPVLPALRSLAVTTIQLYGFVLMFIVAVSLRAFPIFFQRPPAQRRATLVAWAAANGGLAAYVSGLLWRSYDLSADVRVVQTTGFLVLGLALIAIALLLGIFGGEPHRLRASARNSMWFVRSAYAWLVVAAGLQAFYAARALVDESFIAYYQTDAIRHFLALGFMTTMIIGMAFLVLPPLAMRRVTAKPVRLAVPVLLAFLHGATAARGAGSLLVSEAQVDNGFWVMSVGGMAAIVAMALFAVHLLRRPQGPEISLSQVESR